MVTCHYGRNRMNKKPISTIFCHDWVSAGYPSIYACIWCHATEMEPVGWHMPWLSWLETCMVLTQYTTVVHCSWVAATPPRMLTNHSSVLVHVLQVCRCIHVPASRTAMASWTVAGSRGLWGPHSWMQSPREVIPYSQYTWRGARQTTPGRNASEPQNSIWWTWLAASGRPRQVKKAS